MRVEELVEKLQKMDQKLEVVLHDRISSYDHTDIDVGQGTTQDFSKASAKAKKKVFIINFGCY